MAGLRPVARASALALAAVMLCALAAETHAAGPRQLLQKPKDAVTGAGAGATGLEQHITRGESQGRQLLFRLLFCDSHTLWASTRRLRHGSPLVALGSRARALCPPLPLQKQRGT